jgi:hypothetical protein
MTTQLDFKKRKKGTANSDVKTENSQVLLPHTIDEKQAYDLMDSQAFCSLCESYHKPNAKLRCALNRAIRKIGEETPYYEQKKGNNQV